MPRSDMPSALRVPIVGVLRMIMISSPEIMLKAATSAISSRIATTFMSISCIQSKRFEYL